MANPRDKAVLDAELDDLRLAERRRGYVEAIEDVVQMLADNSFSARDVASNLLIRLGEKFEEGDV